MYVNFKFCNSKGQRLAVFADVDPNNPDQTLIWILKCSKKDAFSRKRAREIYYNWKFSGGQAVYYTTTVQRDENGNIIFNSPGVPSKTYVKNEAHPEIVILPVPFQQERVNFYLRAMFYKFVPKSEVTRVVKLFYEKSLSYGQYIEK